MPYTPPRPALHHSAHPAHLAHPARPRTALRRTAGVLAALTHLTLVAGLLAPSAAADPIAPKPLPDEPDTAAVIRQADAADALAGATRAKTPAHAFAPQRAAGSTQAVNPGLDPSTQTALRAAALAAPVATRALPALVDVRPAYTGQNSCDPVDKAGATAYARLMTSTYGVGYAGISRWCNNAQSEHLEGRAIDWMLDSTKPDQKAVGDAAVAWLSANNGENARRLGVMYLIWNKKMWRGYAPERGWQDYTGANPHTDHIHTSLTWDGAMQRTSWWTGSAVTTADLGPCRVYAGSPAPIYTGRRTGGCPATIPTPTSTYAVFVPGQKSSTIAIAQRALGITDDGQFGYGTRRAVLDYQGRQGLARTGVLDKATWAKLVPASAAPQTPSAPPPAATDPKVTQPPVRALPARITTRYSTYKSARIALGSKGSAVRVLQKGLKLPSTGTFDARTRAALVTFQKSWRLPATGRTDLKTWNRLELRQFPWLAFTSTTVQRGQSGRVVTALQQALRVTADGSFGRQTATAVMTVQARYGLTPNGVVDPTTWRAVVAQAPR